MHMTHPQYHTPNLISMLTKVGDRSNVELSPFNVINELDPI